MFDMITVGRNIAELRKRIRLTQPALADRLGISFQAVSNWERGESMPDISKLPELSALFRVSVDEILGIKPLTSAPAVQEEHGNCTNEIALVQEEHATPPQPTQAQELAGALTDLSDLSELSELSALSDLPDLPDLPDPPDPSDFAVLPQLLPHMSEMAVAQLARKHADNMAYLTLCLPFMNEADVAEMAHQAILKHGTPAANKFLPFMHEEDIANLATAHMENMSFVRLCLPFMHEEDVAEMAKNAVRKGGLQAATPFIQYMHEEDVDALAHDM